MLLFSQGTPRVVLPKYILLSPFFRGHDNSVKRNRVRDLEVTGMTDEHKNQNSWVVLALASTVNPASVTWEQRAASRILTTHRFTYTTFKLHYGSVLSTESHHLLANWEEVLPCSVKESKLKQKYTSVDRE